MKEKKEYVIDSTILKKLSKMIGLFVNSTVGDDTDKTIGLTFDGEICNIYLENQFAVFDYNIELQGVVEGVEKKVVLDARTFCEVVKNSTGNVSIVVNDSYVVFKYGRSQYKIPVLGKQINKVDVSDFLSVDMDIEWFNYKVGCVSHCLAKDDVTPALEHIYFYNDYIVATDSIYGAVTKYVSAKTFNGHSLSKAALSMISALPVKRAKAGFNGSVFCATADGMLFKVSIDVVDYPITMIANIIDKIDDLKKSNIDITLSPVDIESAINRLCYFVDKDSPFIRMTANKIDSSIDLTVSNHDNYGDENVSIAFNNFKIKDEYSILLDGKALARTLKALGGGECHLLSQGVNDIQYVTDFETCIFFFGTNK